MTKAKKSLGQHFLIDPLIINQIIEALNPQPGETILEIGPGEGVLTLPLVNSGADIVAVELDRRLAPGLAKKFSGKENFRVRETDILTVNPQEAGLDIFAVIGNLPYNITTPIMDWLMMYHAQINRAVFMMQKEVADRVTSPPGKKARSTISVLTSLYFDSEIICPVPPDSFRPPPKVDSTVVRFTRHDSRYQISDIKRFEKFVRNSFSGKRKSLLNNLNSAYPLPRAELEKIIVKLTNSSTTRAEQLELDAFIELADTIFQQL
ncbi:MAG: 16S rRNA (adenine(1518)-N(6)/adenine(1519)-N(6))-dimethyltransferase RsmA [candidate division Zixibacteria bacterium]